MPGQEEQSVASTPTPTVTSPPPPMTSTQVRYASHGTSDIATEPKGPYGPNMNHERFHEPTLALSPYERGRTKPFKLYQRQSRPQQKQAMPPSAPAPQQ